MKIISLQNFLDVDIRCGTILKAEQNNALKNPSIILTIDFGQDIGLKKSSAQLQKNYSLNQLINKQVVAVINFQPKQIGKMISEVLVVGFPDTNNQAILISPDNKIKNGCKLF